MLVSFSCVCPVTDHAFCHNIVKVAVDPPTYQIKYVCMHLCIYMYVGDIQMDPLTSLIVSWQDLLSITEQTHEKADLNFFYN